MKPVRDLANAHPGRLGAVLGGGPSLPAHVGQIPSDALMISVNQHGALLTRCDYIVHKDWTLTETLRLLPAPRVSVAEADPDYFWGHGDGVRDNGFSSSVAVWLALHMGCREVVLCGMDCYRGDATYWHTPKAASTGHFWTPERHLERWRETFPGEPRIKAMGGLLTEVFPKWP